MQNTFSFSRLWLLIKKQWFDNTRLYILSALALTGLLIFIFLIWWLSGKYEHRFSEEVTNVVFFVGLFVAGSVFASTTFTMLGDKAKGIYWLSVPATSLEKLACGFFYSCIVFPAVYFTAFWLIKHITFFLIELNPLNVLVRTDPNDIFEKEVTPILFYVFFAVQSLFMLGSVYFERLAFIKTAIVTLLIGFLFVIFIQFLVHNLLPDSFGVRSFSKFIIYENNQPPKIYLLPHWVEDILQPLAQFIWVPVFLTAAYFRLKEKEI